MNDGRAARWARKKTEEQHPQTPAESKILKQTILRLAAVPGVRIWRMNAGKGYGAGIVVKAMRLLWSGDARAALELLKRSRPIEFGVVGQADAAGIVGPEGWRLDIECKTEDGKQRAAQKLYGAMIDSHGGIYMIVRDADKAVEDLKAILTARRSSVDGRCQPERLTGDL